MTPESPLMVESREELVFLLGEACEIEHGLMCEYLYAQFSLKRGGRGGPHSRTADSGSGMGDLPDRHHQAGDAAPGSGHEHPDRRRGSSSLRAA